MSSGRIGDLGIAGVSLAITWCVLALVACVVGCARLYQVELHIGGIPRVSITALFVVCLAMVLAIHAIASEGRSALVLAIANLGWAPAFFLCGLYALDDVIFKGGYFADPQTDVPWWLLLVGAACPFFTMPLALLAPSLEKLPYLRFAGIAVWLLGALLVVAGWTRARWPDPDTYATRATPMKTLADDERFDLDGIEVLYTKEPICGSYTCCHLEIAGPSMRRLTDQQLPCGGIAIARDDASKLWLIGDPQTGGTALKMGTLKQTQVRAKIVHASIGPPIGWLLGGTAGIALALVPLVAAFARKRDPLGATTIAIVAITCATLASAAALRI